jgi:hypothetical protein
MVKTQLFIDMLEAGRVTSVTSARGHEGGQPARPL